MSETNKSRLFATGCNVHDGTCCPARTVGYDPSGDDSLFIAQEYDRVALEYGFAKGTDRAEFPDNQTIGEEEAKTAWLNAIEKLNAKGQREHAEIGREVAEQLGWM